MSIEVSFSLWSACSMLCVAHVVSSRADLLYSAPQCCGLKGFCLATRCDIPLAASRCNPLTKYESSSIEQYVLTLVECLLSWRRSRLPPCGGSGVVSKLVASLVGFCHRFPYLGPCRLEQPNGVSIPSWCGVGHFDAVRIQFRHRDFGVGRYFLRVPRRSSSRDTRVFKTTSF